MRHLGDEPGPFSELVAKMSPASRERMEAKTATLRGQMPLIELRNSLEISQAFLAESLGIDQPSISRMEHRDDMMLGTLKRYIEALGGRLEIRAVFDDGEPSSVEIVQPRSIVPMLPTKKKGGVRIPRAATGGAQAAKKAIENAGTARAVSKKALSFYSGRIGHVAAPTAPMKRKAATKKAPRARARTHA